MSKIGNAIKMMMLIQSRGRMKCCELAQELEVTERQIQKYICCIWNTADTKCEH